MLPANHLFYLLFSFQRPAFSSTAVLRQKETLSNRCRPVKVFFYSFSNRPAIYSSASAGCTFRQQAPFLTDFIRYCQGLFPASKQLQRERPLRCEEAFWKKFRRRPTFPHSYPCSIIGAAGLNFCVRDGNRCDPCAIATENLITGFQLPKTVYDTFQAVKISVIRYEGWGEANLAPSLRKLFMVKPHGQLVPVS